MRLDISDIAADFPDFRVAAVVATDLAIPDSRSRELDRLIGEREAALRERWAGMELSEIPGVAAWRRAYRAFGIKKTSYRSSVERLVKNALAERPLPAINPFVDCYNAVSLTHVFPLGADDLDKVEGDIAFRYSRSDDSFLDMGAEGEANDPPKPGEVAPRLIHFCLAQPAVPTGLLGPDGHPARGGFLPNCRHWLPAPAADSPIWEPPALPRGPVRKTSRNLPI